MLKIFSGLGFFKSLTVLFMICVTSEMMAQPTPTDISDVLMFINKLRSKGCLCGNEYMPPVSNVIWDNTLYYSAKSHAQYMERTRHFDHIDKYGRDLGDRLDRLGYKWHYFGENLAIGYRDFHEVLKAWRASPSHCRMLMNQNMTAIGLSRYKKYWALSMASPIPEYMKEMKVARINMPTLD